MAGCRCCSTSALLVCWYFSCDLKQLIQRFRPPLTLDHCQAWHVTEYVVDLKYEILSIRSVKPQIEQTVDNPSSIDQKAVDLILKSFNLRFNHPYILPPKGYPCLITRE